MGIEWCMENNAMLSENCLKKAARDFDEDVTVNKMIETYKSLYLQGGGGLVTGIRFYDGLLAD